MPAFVPRQRKHKIRKREHSAQNEPSDSNEIQLLPTSKAEKEEKRKKLKDELRAGQSKISSKKQKRLDKYIENKLKKDENVELLRKLEDAKVHTAGLQSSRHLGKRTFLNFAEDFATSSHPSKPSRKVNTEELSDIESEDSFEQDHSNAFGEIDEQTISVNDGLTESLGSGLKMPLALGEDGLPIIQMRPNKKKAKVKIAMDDIPWEGFASELEAVSENKEYDESGSDSVATESGSEVESEITEQSDSTLSGIYETPAVAPRKSAFKSWATQQVNKSLGHTPSYDQEQPIFVARSDGPSNNDRQLPVTTKRTSHLSLPAVNPSQADPEATRTAFSIHVQRAQSIQESRMSLPILAEEQNIMEAIYNNSVVLVWGATGSGKTTQVPQFLFEAGFGSPNSPTPGIIGITQPRRVAAISMANRVKDELGQHAGKVAHQVRFDSSTSAQTAIKYMTDGILLRELSKDVMLMKYSVLVIDEAHERSVNTDVLIGMLSRIVPLRWKLSKSNPSINPLKLVIMSATLRTSDFLQNPRLFKPDPSPPPLVQAEGRQFPVTIHFARQTKRDYLDEVCQKVVKAHWKLPRGGILVFLTGQNEIKSVRETLLETLPSVSTNTKLPKVQIASSETPLETEDMEFGYSGPLGDNGDDSDLDIITGLDEDDDETAWEEKGDAFELNELPNTSSNVHILPLYSQLPTKEQMKVFDAPPEGSRLIILATNVAETSLTIPGIRYVFDCGRSKERVYNQITGVQTFETNWISKASAEQRAGRAGRTEAGHSYRLYSSAVYERDFAQHADPEILRTPIESVVLQLKSFHVENVINFPFPTPPPRDSLLRAERLLKNLGALSSDGRITTVGAQLNLYPLSPRLSKILNVALSTHPELVSEIAAIVAGISVGELFVPESLVELPCNEGDEGEKSLKQNYGRARALFSKTDPKSDILKMFTAISKYDRVEDKAQFCESMFLRSKAMQEATQLRYQLFSIARANNSSLTLQVKASMPPSKECTILNEIVASGYIDQIAIRADQAPNPPEMLRRPKRAIDVPYIPLIPLQNGRSALTEKAIYLHPTSVLSRLSANEMPTYLVYSHLQQSQPSAVESQPTSLPKTRMFPLAPIRAEQLAVLAHETPLLDYGKPIGHKITMLGGTPERRECWVVPSLVGEAGTIGWPLPARKVVQRKDVKVGWVIETFLS